MTFEAADFETAYEGMRGLLGVAQSGYINIAAGLFLKSGDDAFMQFKEAIFESWQETAVAPSMTEEREEASDSPSAAAAPAPKPLYFGSR